MFRYKAPTRIIRDFPQKHLTNLDPVSREWTTQQGFQLTPPAIGRGPFVEFGWETLKETDGDVAVLK
jgi:hypothetical protein